MSALSDIVAKFRKGSPNIALAFDEVERRLVVVEDSASRAWLELAEHEARLDALETTDPPPPPPPPPPTGFYWQEQFATQPAQDWAYEYNGSRVNWPHPQFTLQPNGEGGSCLRIGAPPNSPSGQGVLGAMYCFGGSSRARGKPGDEYWLKFRFRFNDQFKGWVFEQHEHYSGPPDIYSNGLRVTPERKLLIQRTGGPASLHPSAEGWHTTDTETLVPGRWYDVLHHVRWSGGTDGFYRVWLNGRQITINRGEASPTLITSGSFVDSVGLGFYAYLYGQNTGAMYTEFDYAVQGPTRASVGS